MKKSIISFIAIAMMAVTTIFAQSSLVATLVHNDTIKAFYGPEALQLAYQSAVNGDTINLSEGSFYSTDIGKSLTIRGAGMALDTIARTGITTIAGEFVLQTKDITIEGIYSNNTIKYFGDVSNTTFIKCRLQFIAPYSEGGDSRLEATFVNCRIVDALLNYARYKGPSFIECINCIVREATYSSASVNNRERSYLFKNCIIKDVRAPGGATTTYNNCIFVYDDSNRVFDTDGVTVFNCIEVADTEREDNGIFKNIGNTSNKSVTDFSKVFKTFRGGDFLETEDFELTDAAKTTYLGMDGKEVGIHGGNVPYRPTLDFPQITKCVVADKTTADGKLSISIEVKNAN